MKVLGAGKGRSTSSRSGTVWTKSHFWCISFESWKAGLLPNLHGIHSSTVWTSSPYYTPWHWPGYVSFAIRTLLGVYLENKALLTCSWEAESRRQAFSMFFLQHHAVKLCVPLPSQICLNFEGSLVKNTEYSDTHKIEQFFLGPEHETDGPRSQ